MTKTKQSTCCKHSYCTIYTSDPSGFCAGHIMVGGCAPGCSRNERPYCHCQACGETFVVLDEDGYCSTCREDDGAVGWSPDMYTPNR